MHVTIAQEISKHSELNKNSNNLNAYLVESAKTNSLKQQHHENFSQQQRLQQVVNTSGKQQSCASASNNMLQQQQNVAKNSLKSNNNLTQQNLLASAMQLQQQELLQQNCTPSTSAIPQANSSKMGQQQFRITTSNLMPNRNTTLNSMNMKALNQKSNLQQFTSEQAFLTQQLFNPLFYQGYFFLNC